MNRVFVTLVSAAVASAFAVSATAQTSGSKKSQQKAESVSGDYWWNAENAAADAKSRNGTMTTGLDPKGGGAGSGAAAGDAGTAGTSDKGGSGASGKMEK